MNIVIKELPEYEVAFIRRTGSYFEPTEDHWGKLINWAVNNGLYPPSQHCRHDACVTIPQEFEKEKHNGIQFRSLDGGQYALYEYYGKELNLAYQYMYGEWLPNSDYEPDYDRYNLEFNMNNPADDPEGKAKVHLYVPVQWFSN